MHSDGKVVLFPKWKSKLEEESLKAIKEKQYGKALQKLNELISYKVINHETMTGKLICLMELGNYEEAQMLCEELIAMEDENYYQYLHIYLTLLFQTSQYELLMEQVEYIRETEHIPDPYNEQFDQLYDMSRKMNDQLTNDKLTRYIKQFFQAIDDEDYNQQWLSMENIRKTSRHPGDLERFYPLLEQDRIHPVVKTSIFQWLQELNISTAVTVRKLQLTRTVEPDQIPIIDEHPVRKETGLVISELEQENPALYQMLVQLFHQYIYVRYPITPLSSDVPDIAEALVVIGKERLNLPIKAEPNNKVFCYHKQHIEQCEALYLSIIDA